jgi:hypothetical protein
MKVFVWHEEHFYREFHDLVTKAMPKFIQDCIRVVPTALETVGRRENKKMLKERDRREKVENAVVKIQSHPAFATTAGCRRGRPPRCAAGTNFMPA